ncbi:MAG: mannose-6-phosphate isomerase [Pseudonocardiaceae bacterium]|nr:mannose-6-phosphate isomerase [Pseudonocardiaceae bacterium]
MNTGSPTPTRLPANQPPQFYRGGAAIAEFRGAREAAGYGPEDWVASTTTMFGQEVHGLSVLPDGRLLRDAVLADPTGWLGAEHVEAFGASTGLLVKLLDAGQRLPVHCHPDDSFARQHFSSHCGKTEAWVVIGTEAERGTVHLGFRENQDADTVAEWVANQDRDAMLGALNSLEVSAGDTVFVPAGVPHAIGAGVFIVELQQPTDLSVTLEWRDFLAGPDKGHLGIGYRTALRCLDRSGWPEHRLSSLRHRSANGAAGDGSNSSNGSRARTNLLGRHADPFFRAEWLHAEPGMRLERSFGVLVILSGQAMLHTEAGDRVPVAKGDTVLLPHAAGTTTVDGDLAAVHCRPPGPANARSPE